jgi:hypothetical protein
MLKGFDTIVPAKMDFNFSSPKGHGGCLGLPLALTARYGSKGDQLHSCSNLQISYYGSQVGGFYTVSGDQAAQ